MKTRILVLAVSLGLLAGACRSPVDEQWGHSIAAARTAQLADPNAPANDEPALGMDAKSGEAVAERYYEGQRTQYTRQAPSIVITGN